MRPILVVDTETVPDVQLIVDRHPEMRKLDDVSWNTIVDNEEAVDFVTDKGKKMLKPIYQKVVSIAVAHVDEGGTVRVWKAMEYQNESDLLKRFWDAYTALGRVRLVTFNGRRFDVPLLAQRALYNGHNPAAYWRMDRNRYHTNDHFDLMDVSADYGGSIFSSQDELALMFHVPGKLDVHGDMVADMYAQGKQKEIDDYCACDVATLTLCYGQYVHLDSRGTDISAEELNNLTGSLHAMMKAQVPEHPLYEMFLKEWVPF